MGDYLDAPQADDHHTPATYTQASAVQARARQPMDALKVAKRDTQTPQHTAVLGLMATYTP